MGHPYTTLDAMGTLVIMVTMVVWGIPSHPDICGVISAFHKNQILANMPEMFIYFLLV
jgi:hypothetical protein